MNTTTRNATDADFRDVTPTAVKEKSSKATLWITTLACTTGFMTMAVLSQIAVTTDLQARLDAELNKGFIEKCIKDPTNEKYQAAKSAISNGLHAIQGK